MKMRRMLQQQQSIHTRHPNLLDVLFALWLTINSCLCIYIADNHQHEITIAIPILYNVPYLQLVVIFFLSGIHITTSTFILFCTLCWQVVPFPSCCVCTLATGFTQNDFLGRRRKTKNIDNHFVLHSLLAGGALSILWCPLPLLVEKNIHLLDCFPF